MASPTNTLFQLTGDSLVDAVTNGTTWISQPESTIYWSISNGFFGEQWFNPAFLVDGINTALMSFSSFTNLTFQYVGYYNDPTFAAQAGSDINISLDGAGLFFGSSNTLAIGNFPYLPWETTYAGQAGDIFANLNSAINTLPSFAPGSQGFFILLHELGHTLGLKHTHDNGGTGAPTLGNIGLASFDKDWFSMMSYDDDFSFNQIAFDPATPMVLDVIGLQALYGKNQNTNSGNNIHQLSTTNLYETIWDAGGVDRIDASAANQGWFIEMPDTVLSTLIGEKFGFATPLADLALSSPKSFYWLEGDFENAAGSIYTDVIVGNALANVIFGNGGDDIISGRGGNDDLFGGGGFDTAVFSGNLADYVISAYIDGSYTIADSVFGRDGIDAVIDIEFFEFADQTIAAGVPVAIDWRNDTASIEIIASTYQFFTDVVPGATGFEFLISSPNNSADLNDPYYAQFNTENRYINFANNLGVFGDGKAAFAARYYTLTFQQTVQVAFEEIISAQAIINIGGSPQAAIDFFIGAYDYYAAVANERVVPSGVSFDQAVKAVAIGSILNEAMKENLGKYSDAVDVLVNDITITGTSSLFGHDLII